MMNWKRHSISGAFVFLLLGVFAVFSMLLTVLGAQAYREIIDDRAVIRESGLCRRLSATPCAHRMRRTLFP